jgi:hypothetical protein
MYFDRFMVWLFMKVVGVLTGIVTVNCKEFIRACLRGWLSDLFQFGAVSDCFFAAAELTGQIDKFFVRPLTSLAIPRMPIESR